MNAKRTAGQPSGADPHPPQPPAEAQPHPATAGDLLELRALADRYAHCLDDLDQESFEQLWTAEGVLEVFENGPSRPPTGTLRRKHFHFAFERLAQFQRTMHYVSTHYADIDADEAHGTTRCTAHHIARPGGPAATDLVMHIRYQDRYLREHDKWHFAHRRVEVLFRETTSVEELP